MTLSFPDITKYIISFLPDPRDCAALSQVSSSVRHAMGGKEAVVAAGIYNLVSQIDLSYVSSDQLVDKTLSIAHVALKSGGRLTQLFLSQFTFDEYNLLPELEQLPLEEQFQVMRNEVWVVGENEINLEAFSLKPNIAINLIKKHLISICEACSTAEALFLGSYPITDEELANVLTLLPNLTTLSIYQAFNLSAARLAQISNCPKLTSLSLLNTQAFDQLPVICFPYLIHFEYSGETSLNFFSLPNLVYLVIYSLTPLINWSRFSNLKELTLFPDEANLWVNNLPEALDFLQLVSIHSELPPLEQWKCQVKKLYLKNASWNLNLAPTHLPDQQPWVPSGMALSLESLTLFESDDLDIKPHYFPSLTEFIIKESSNVYIDFGPYIIENKANLNLKAINCKELSFTGNYSKVKKIELHQVDWNSFTPNHSNFFSSNLEELIITQSNPSEELPGGLLDLSHSKLKTLTLDQVSNFSLLSLPPTLEHLRIHSSPITLKPTLMMCHLQTLDLFDIPIESLSFPALRLQSILVHSCHNLKDIDLSTLALRKLSLSHLYELNLISLGRLSEFSEIEIIDCPQVKILSNTPEQEWARSLHLEQPSPQVLSLIGSFSNIEHLFIKSDFPFFLPPLHHFHRLKTLHLEGILLSSELSLPLGIEDVTIIGEDFIESLETAEMFPSTINFSTNNNLRSIHIESAQVTNLIIGAQPYLTHIILKNMPGLTAIDANGCPELKALELAHVSIEHLFLIACSKIKNLKIEGENLQTLILHENTLLQNLWLDDPSLVTIGNIQVRENLTILHGSLPLLTALPADLHATSVYLEYCEASCLAWNAPSLFSFEIHNSDIEELDLSGMNHLVQLEVTGCSTLKSIRNTAALQSRLQTVKLDNNCNLNTLELGEYHHLKQMNISRHTFENLILSLHVLTDLRLEACKIDTTLILDCPNLLSLTLNNSVLQILDISELISLNYLEITDCNFLQKILNNSLSESCLERMKLDNNRNLTELDIIRYPQLKELEISRHRFNRLALSLPELIHMQLEACQMGPLVLDCPKLPHLRLIECTSQFLDLSWLASVKSINLFSCEFYQLINSKHQEHLVNFTITNSHIPSFLLRAYTQLNEVRIVRSTVDKLKLDSLPRLADIKIENSPSIQTLDVRDCPNLSQDSFNYAYAYIRLNGNFNNNIFNFTSSLRGITFENCYNNFQLSFKNFVHLETLRIRNCPNFRNPILRNSPLIHIDIDSPWLRFLMRHPRITWHIRGGVFDVIEKIVILCFTVLITTLTAYISNAYFGPFLPIDPRLPLFARIARAFLIGSAATLPILVCTSANISLCIDTIATYNRYCQALSNDKIMESLWQEFLNRHRNIKRHVKAFKKTSLARNILIIGICVAAYFLFKKYINPLAQAHARKLLDLDIAKMVADRANNLPVVYRALQTERFYRYYYSAIVLGSAPLATVASLAIIGLANDYLRYCESLQGIQINEGRGFSARFLATHPRIQRLLSRG